MNHKSFKLLETKADAEAGTFEALVAVFGNVDSGGDRIQPGAFTKSLKKWRESGDPIPIILSHQWDNPMAHIGIADPNDVNETDRGLVLRGRLDIDDNDVARQVHKLMRRRSLKEFSFAYKVPDGGMKRDKSGVNDLFEVDIAEVGPTLKGMNPATELHEVKSALDKEPAEIDPEALLRDSQKMLRDIKTAGVPAAPPVEEKADPPGGVDAETYERVRMLEDRMTAIEQRMDDMNKATDRTDRPRQRRSDPDQLERRSRQLIREVASLGIPTRQTQPPATQEPPEPSDEHLDALKRQSRDLIVDVLTHNYRSETEPRYGSN